MRLRYWYSSCTPVDDGGDGGAAGEPRSLCAFVGGTSDATSLSSATALGDIEDRTNSVQIVA